jgi:hypothetical protein
MDVARLAVLNVVGVIVLAAFWHFVVRDRLERDGFRRLLLVVLSLIFVGSLYLLIQDARSS